MERDDRGFGAFRCSSRPVRLILLGLNLDRMPPTGDQLGDSSAERGELVAGPAEQGAGLDPGGELVGGQRGQEPGHLHGCDVRPLATQDTLSSQVTTSRDLRR